MPKKNLFKVNLLLLLAVIILAVAPILLLQDAEFEGADGQAVDVITEMNTNYQPWFEPLWEPPSGEIESLLFAVQAAIGAGFICYWIGYMRGKRKAENDYNVESRSVRL